jgi:hypothetical protein
MGYTGTSRRRLRADSVRTTSFAIAAQWQNPVLRGNMLRPVLLSCLLRMGLARAAAQGQPGKAGVPVEVVATASEYVPLSRTIPHPGHAYTNCEGSTSYFGQFSNYGYSGLFLARPKQTRNAVRLSRRLRRLRSPPIEE